ncbi:hypothetical protein [Solwaraspora sp. WMMA2056]|uniref:hypothetical protein n=1 Tax=Solwaraspora sp. WMMA2056 TaxID=3015161 RepID=UPI00338E4B26
MTALGALLMTSAACGGDDAGEPASNAAGAAPAASAAPSAAAYELRDLVTPAGAGHPAKGKLIEADFHEAGEKGLLVPPEGMTYSPDSCVNFIDLGDPAQLDGWLQFNEAAPVGKSHNLAHKDFFVGTVFRLPGGVDVAKLKAKALTCDDGSVSLLGDNGVKITGTLTNTEVEPVNLPGATTFEMTQRLQFAKPKDAKAKAVLEQYYGELDADGGVLRVKQIIIVAISNVLYVVNMQDRDAARQLATDFDRRAITAGLK